MSENRTWNEKYPAAAQQSLKQDFAMNNTAHYVRKKIHALLRLYKHLLFLKLAEC